MELEANSPITTDICSTSASNSEFLDAEGDGDGVDDFFHDAIREQEEQKHSIIQDIREEIQAETQQIDGVVTRTNNQNSVPQSQSSPNLLQASCSNNSSASSTTSSNDHLNGSVSELNLNENHDYLKDPIWRNHKKHIFILSEAGKPIYSLHGREDKLATLFGIIQVLVSVVQVSHDTITSINANGIQFVFLVRNSLILVAASRSRMSVPQLQMQLIDVYNQILSILTYSRMKNIFENIKNFDLRRLLRDSERFIKHLLTNDSSNGKVTNNVFPFLTNSIRVLPLPTSIRSNINSAIQANCSKIKKLVFAVLVADNKLITLVRRKDYTIHSADLRLILNLIECSEYFKNVETWTPICLPRFDKDHYLYAYVSYLTSETEACLLLLSVDSEDFHILADAKKRITEKMQKSNCLQPINDELNKRKNAKLNLTALGIPEIRHFLYKPKALAQILCAEITFPYDAIEEFTRLEGIYCDLLHRVHDQTRPLKLIYEVKDQEVVLAWDTAVYELYAIFEPMVDKSLVIRYVDKLIKWIEKEHDVYFIKSHPHF